MGARREFGRLALRYDSFEIQVMRDGRWVTESSRDSKSEAMELAEKFLGKKDCAGARIIANKENRDGSTTETVVFEKTQAASTTKKIQITTIEAAPQYCVNPRDFFSLESRMLMNRVARNYLEEVMLTPTELLHGYRDLQRFKDYENIFPSAVGHIATLQTANGGGKSPLERRNEIYAICDQITERARRADGVDLPKLGQSFAKTLAAVSGAKGEKAEYLAMVVLARELSGTRSWVGKLDTLCKLAAAEAEPKATLLLDTVIADVLGANVIQEVLGWKRSLGSAIIAMLDLADGRFDPAESDAADTVALLNQLFREGALPASRHVMIDRAIRQLKSPAPLYRADPSKEMEEYQRVLARLLVPGGILSGADAAEALTVRGARFVEQGGASGRRAAIDATVKALPDPARGVMYLAELTNSSFANEHLDDIVQQLDVVFGARVIDELCRRVNSPKDRMVTATGAFRATLSSALPDEIKSKVTEHIDGVLERYLVDENIIDKLDSPDSHIRDRAVRLVKFCGAGVLPEGKALNMARKRVVQLLRQPNFDAHFIEGIGDAAASENALRGFHKLLKKAGLA
jgi:hypothetical protein